jgi:hypothetical protein
MPGRSERTYRLGTGQLGKGLRKPEKLTVFARREILVFHFETINPRLPLGSGIQGLEDLC